MMKLKKNTLRANIDFFSKESKNQYFPVKNTRFCVSVSFFILLSLISASCTKKDTSAKAVILVLDTSDQPVEYVKVNFYVDSKNVRNDALDTTITTDASGIVEFERKNECVLDVDAKKVIGNTAITGKTTIWMKQDKTVRDTIIVR